MTTATVRVMTPSAQAYQILHLAYTVAPIIAGADKFTHWLVNWDQYLAPIVSRWLGKATSFLLEVSWSRETAAKANRLRSTVQTKPLTRHPSDPATAKT